MEKKREKNLLQLLHQRRFTNKHMKTCSITVIRKKQVKTTRGTSLVVQWLRCHIPNVRGLGSIPVQGTRSHMLQLRVYMPQLRPSTAK